MGIYILYLSNRGFSIAPGLAAHTARKMHFPRWPALLTIASDVVANAGDLHPRSPIVTTRIFEPKMRRVKEEGRTWKET
jgi:hypothetical protein